MAHSTRSRSVVLYHVCPAHAARSILRGGVCPALSRSSFKVSWFCARSRRVWALSHVMCRHSVPAAVVMRFRVPRSWLCRFARGIWTCSRPVPAELCISVSLPMTAAEADAAA